MTTMATRSRQNGKVGAQAPTTPISKEAVAHVIAQIELGLMDSYLRATWEAITNRKAALESGDGLPVQHKVEPAMIKWDIDHDGEAEDKVRTIKATVGDPQPAFQPTPAVIDAPVEAAPQTRRRRSSTKNNALGHVSARPVVVSSKLTPLMPLTRIAWTGMDEFSVFKHNGLTYLKSHFKGHQVDGLTTQGGTIRFQIRGVGNRAVQCLIVTEPPRGAMSGKSNLWDKYHANEPVFMPHTLIEPWLIVPADVTPYI